MKSAFLSDLFHALRASDPFVMPVSENAICWLTSIECAADNFAHALVADLMRAPENRAITLPALQVRVSDLSAEIVEQTGSSQLLVSYAPDPPLEANFGRYPPLQTLAADALGFTSDGDLPTLVERALMRSTAPIRR